jgi:hypothetical protein
MIPAIVMLVTYATYTLLMKQELTGTSNIADRKSAAIIDTFSFQDFLHYNGVFFVEDAATTVVI